MRRLRVRVLKESPGTLRRFGSKVAAAVEHPHMCFMAWVVATATLLARQCRFAGREPRPIRPGPLRG